MSRELLVVWAGRRRKNAWEELCAQYRERITKLVPVRDLAVRSRTAEAEAKRLRVEGKALEEALPDPCWTVALDRRGKSMGSVDFSRRLHSIWETWPHAIAFLVGSDLGLDPDLLGRARLRLSLGPLTLPHELARLVLYEQLYRAVALQAGIKYHRPPLP